MLAGVVLYGLFVAYTGFSEITDSLRRFAPEYFAAAVLLASANYALRIVRWNYYLRVLGIGGISRLDRALHFLSGFVLTVTPGKLGEVFKSAVMAETHGIPPEHSAPIVIAERLADVISIVLLLLFGAGTFPGGLPWAFAGGGAVAFGMLLILWERPGRIVLGYLEGTWMRRIVPRINTAWAHLRHLAGPRLLLVPTVLGLIGWALEGTGLMLLIWGFGESMTWSTAAFFYATATLAGALVPVPGGLGVTETLMQQQLVQLGAIELGNATAAMLLLRLATLWWAVLVGFAALGILKRRYPQLLSKAAPARP